MRKLLKEPLLHFLLLGAAIFAAHHFLSSPNSDTPDRIIVTQGKIENLALTFTRTWQRPPTEQELQGLIRDYVREEVAYREARALGLDQDDTIIRRRLRQKLEFVSNDLIAQVEPTDAELQSFLNSHAEKFKAEPQYSFRQIFFNPERHGDHLKTDAGEILAALQQKSGQSDEDIAKLGDTFLLDQHFQNVTSSDISRMFGEPFAADLSTVPPGQWQGPFESGYGLHLVYVQNRVDGRLPAMNEVRDVVQREWANTKQQEGNEKFYQMLLGRYTVTIEKPPEKVQAKALR